jgi:hypothetical protein
MPAPRYESGSSDDLGRFWNSDDAVTASGRDDVRRSLRLMAEPGAASALVFDGRSKLDQELRISCVEEDEFVGSMDGAELEPGRRYGFVARQTRAVLAFGATLLGLDGDALRFALPAEIVHSGFRRGARASMTQVGTITLAFAHPRLGFPLTAMAVNVSESGLAASLEPNVPVLAAGDPLSIRISFADAVVRARGKVRHARSGAFGLELLLFDSEAEREAWQSFAFRLTHPRVVHDHRAAWPVLESSGYLELWAGDQDRAALAAEHSAFWDDEDSTTGRLSTLLDGARPVATMAANLLHPRTWMLHHFGVDRAVRADRAAFLSYSRELYSAAVHGLERVAELEYVTMCVEAGKGFSDYLYGNFARMYRRPDELKWTRSLVFRADTRHAPHAALASEAVRAATPEDLALVAAACARTRTRLEILAHDLDAEGLSREGFARRLAPRRPVRSRETYVFVAEGGRPTWAIVCETGSEGANVFGLLNRCWLAELSASTRGEASVARRALLGHAIRHFSEAGKRRVVLLGEPGDDVEDPPGAGFAFVSTGCVWLSRREVLPAWLAYVHDALSLPRVAPSRTA